MGDYRRKCQSYDSHNVFSPDNPDALHFLLGCDGLGRDILSRIIYGARISIFIGLAVILVATSIGVLPRNGRSPVSSSYSTIPREKMSLRKSISSPLRACSGEA